MIFVGSFEGHLRWSEAKKFTRETGKTCQMKDKLDLYGLCLELLAEL